MPNFSGSKLKILYLYKLFMEKTDEEHSVSMPEIISYLNNNGIHAERKSVYGDIEALRLFGLDIIAERDSNGFAYKLFGKPGARIVAYVFKFDVVVFAYVGEHILYLDVI